MKSLIKNLTFRGYCNLIPTLQLIPLSRCQLSLCLVFSQLSTIPFFSFVSDPSRPLTAHITWPGTFQMTTVTFIRIFFFNNLIYWIWTFREYWRIHEFFQREHDLLPILRLKIEFYPFLVFTIEILICNIVKRVFWLEIYFPL